MSRLTKVALVLSIAFGFGALGCAEQKKPQGPDPLVTAETKIKELEAELARCQADAAACNQRLGDCEKENVDLKSQLLAGAGKAKEEAPPGWKSIPGGVMIAMDGKVLFDSGKSMLRDGGKRELDKIASTIKSHHPDYDVYVFGHTDDQPIKHSKWADNYELSCERSLSVVRYLKGKGVSPKSLAACGWGEYRPVSAGRSAAERAMNRRVEIFVMSPHGGSVPHDSSPDKPAKKAP